MNKINIADAFSKGKAFIPFITCGDPNLETTKEVVYSAVEAGANLIELGIPFSDPTAEGVTIQGANERALKGGVTTDKIFHMVEEIREKVSIPMVFMTYANVLYSYGIEKFAKKCESVGIQGVILPDVPYEEKEEFDSVLFVHGVDLISLIAPTSEDRITEIASEAKGFIYLVSSLGVTGVRSSITTDIGAICKKIKSVTDVPVGVGFGISTPEQAAKMASTADGAIVGSAIIKIIEKEGENAPKHVGEYIKSMADAVHA